MLELWCVELSFEFWADVIDSKWANARQHDSRIYRDKKPTIS